MEEETIFERVAIILLVLCFVKLSELVNKEDLQQAQKLFPQLTKQEK